MLSELPDNTLLNNGDMMSSGSRAIARMIQKKLDANISFQRRKCSLEERVAFHGSEACNPHRITMKKGLAY